MKTMQRVGVGWKLRAVAGGTLAVGLLGWTPAAIGQTATNTWTGGGTPDQGGNWHVAGNWDPVGVPNDTATPGTVAWLPAPSSANRIITNDVYTTVYSVHAVAHGTYVSTVLLNADMNVGTMNHPGFWQPQRVRFNVPAGRTLTVGTNNLATAWMHGVTGSGTVRKIGAGTVKMSIGHPSFTGTYDVREGTLEAEIYEAWSGTPTVEVSDGATYHAGSANNVAAYKPDMRLRGHGYNNTGALRCSHTSGSPSKGSIELVTDATINMDSGRSLGIGVLTGAGALTKIGAGTLNLTGDNSGFQNGVTVKAGTMSVTHTLHGGAITVTNSTLTVSGFITGGPITVQNGGVLNAAPYRVGGVGNVIVEPGGTWDADLRPTWIAGTDFDGNNDGSWQDAANWSDGAVPNDPATNVVLPRVTGNGNSGTTTRTITLNAPVSVRDLVFGYDTTYINRLDLNADMNVGMISSGPVFQGEFRTPIWLNGHTLTIGTNDLPTARLPALLDGGGTLRKIGTGTATLTWSGSQNFTGTIEVREGIFVGSYLVLNANATVDVFPGATHEMRGDGNNTYARGIFRLRGAGFNNNGALWVNITVSRGSIEIVEDASINVSGGTFTLTGGTTGNGVLTKTGTGTLTFGGTWNRTIDGGPLSGVVVQNGVLNINNCTLALTVVGDPPPGRYVLIDHASPTGSLTAPGTFANVTGLPEKWSIEYGPTAIELVNPPPAGTVILLR